MEILPEMESVSLDIDKTRRSSKRSVSSSALNSNKGLGLTAPRRPSDGLMRSHSKVSIQRPISNDSIPSTNESMVFSDAGADIGDSRNSSMTSASVDDVSMGPRTPNMKFKPPLKVSTSTPMFTHSSSSVSTLTPSQRFRLRRVNSQSSDKLNRQNKSASKLYDELNSDDETLEDGVIWNVPFTRTTSSIFNPMNGKSPSLIKSVLNESPSTLPVSPLPGSPLANNTSASFYIHGGEAHSLSQFYEFANERYMKREVLKRKESQTNLPQVINEASAKGLDDCNLISMEKLNIVTDTRPIWLPPKTPDEIQKHDHDYEKMIESFAKKEKLLKQEQLKLKEDQKRYRQRWVDLSQTAHPRHADLSRLCVKCGIPDHLRYELWGKIFQSKDLEDFNKLNEKLSEINDFPESQLEELENLTVKLYPSIQKFQKGCELHDKLIYLLKLSLVSTRGLQNGDEALFAIMLTKFNPVDSYKLVQLLHATVFTPVNNEKFLKHLNKSSVVKKYLPAREYEGDLKSLTSTLTTIQLFEKLPLAIVFPLLDMLVIRNNYKSFLSIWIVVLRNHHIGFDDLKQLFDGDRNVMISENDWFKFGQDINHYYQKF